MEINKYKYILKALWMIGPFLVVFTLLKVNPLCIIAWLIVMCYIELLEINDKLKKQ